MRLAPTDIRFPLLGLLVAMLAALLLGLAALLLAPGLTDRAEATSPCSRYGDTRPRNLTPKHARNAVRCLINGQRDAHGRRRDLHLDGRLQEAARKHSKRMARRHCFSHQCHPERTPLGRAKAANYISGGTSRWAHAEDIGWGLKAHGTPRNVVQGWMHSPPHRAVILSGMFEDIGAGFARRGANAYYTADFGMRRH